MEKWKVIGTQFMNFKAQDGNTVEGLRLYCTGESTGSIKGIPVEKFFCSVNRPEFGALRESVLPVEIEIEFNRYGKPSSYRLVEDKKK